ncbi:hypothetical protein X975_22451, partial [Stegodyphus mimosarum]
MAAFVFKEDTGRRTHYFIGYVDTSRNVKNTQLVRFISGHGPYSEYFFKRGISHTSQCACGDSGSPEHYLTSCPLIEGLHINLPETNRQLFCKYMIKQGYFIKKLVQLMDRLSDLDRLVSAIAQPSM